MNHVRQQPPLPPRGVHHIDHDVAVASTSVQVLLTTTGPATRLNTDRARALGWALIAAAGSVDVRTSA